jgi:hypothetical protein
MLALHALYHYNGRSAQRMLWRARWRSCSLRVLFNTHGCYRLVPVVDQESMLMVTRPRFPELLQGPLRDRVGVTFPWKIRRVPSSMITNT